LRDGKPYTRCHGAVCGTSRAPVRDVEGAVPYGGTIIVLCVSIRCGVRLLYCVCHGMMGIRCGMLGAICGTPEKLGGTSRRRPIREHTIIVMGIPRDDGESGKGFYNDVVCRFFSHQRAGLFSIYCHMFQ